jgi:hypothetical protein
MGEVSKLLVYLRADRWPLRMTGLKGGQVNVCGRNAGLVNAELSIVLPVLVRTHRRQLHPSKIDHATHVRHPTGRRMGVLAMADDVRRKELSRNEWDWLRHIDNRRARMLPEEIEVRLQTLGLIETGLNGIKTTMAGRNLLKAKDEELNNNTRPAG